jgi:uncharacterized protein (TIGR03085 family)
MTRYARLEREGLADDLLAVDPDAATLCEGWTAHDLAAHLVTRERRADAGPGIMLKPFAGWTDRVRDHYRDRYSYPDLVKMVRREPWWSPMQFPPLDEMTNLLEFFVHREDVRRAQPDWPPRALDKGLEEAIWQRVPGMAKLRMRTLRADVTVSAPGYGSVKAGAGGPPIEISGAPGELVLFFFGRRSVAKVDITGPDDLVAKVRSRRYAV